MRLIKKIFNNRIVEIITALLLVYILFIEIGSLLGSLTLRWVFLLHNSVLSFSVMYAAFWGIWLIAILYMLITKKNRPILKALGTKAKGNNIKTALFWGLIFGFGCNILTALVAIINGDIHLVYESFNPGYLVLFLFVVGVQSGAEELCCRVFLYQRLRRSFPKHPAVAIIGNALLFSALHLMNPGVTFLSLMNIILVGILFSEMVYFLDSIWAAIIAHTTWNFTQNILLGLPNSGMVSAYSVFSLDAANATNSFAYNVAFGLEGTIVTAIIFIAGTIFLLFYGTRINPVKALDVWANNT